MKKRLLNILILFIQVMISLILFVYLIVPIYEYDKLSLSGDSMYSPYDNWKQNPVRTISIKEGVLMGTSPDQQLHLYKYLDSDSFYLLDSLKPNSLSPFLLGHSRNDIQYLIKRSGDKKSIIYNSEISTSHLTPPLQGIQMQLINDEKDLLHLDQLLNSGIPMTIVAGEGIDKFYYNQIMSTSGSTLECLNALKEGRNLIVLADKDIFKTGVESIPVIRNIEWKNDELTLDLSEMGNIKIISSGFELDTLSQNLHLKINHASWFRFEVDFITTGISYLSNPFFRYSQEPFKINYPKANNQLTIFINLSWLIALILLNYVIILFRRKYL